MARVLERRFVGTARAGLQTSGHGRTYRVGYAVQTLERSRENLQISLDAERRESPMFDPGNQAGRSDQRVLGHASVQW